MTAHDDLDLLELLDAYVDDELAVEERAAVDELLAASAEARAELAAVERVRSIVRGLPAVDPPFGFYERMTLPAGAEGARSARRGRRPGRTGLVISAVGAVAAAVVLVLAIAPVGDRFTPPVQDVSARHAMLTSANRELPEGYEPLTDADAEVAAPYEAPAQTADGYRRLTVYRAPEGIHILYGNDSTTISVFEQRGRVDWSGLPSGGTRLEVDGDDAWIAAVPATAGPDTLVLARDDLVVTIVGRAPTDEMVELAGEVPDPPAPGVGERVEGACQWIAEGFGFPS